MFYEVEMLGEYVQSILNMCRDVENPENVTIHFCWNMQEHLETIDTEKISTFNLSKKFFDQIFFLRERFPKVIIDGRYELSDFYNIAQYRRDLNHEYCENYDFVIWGETDSMFPEQGLQIIEGVAEHAAKNDVHRYILTFADRRNWDASWDVITHRKFLDVPYQDNTEWIMENEASSKSYMTMERMNEINAEADYPIVETINYPKFDGSCLVISTDLIKSGVNIPHALTHCAEDTSFGEMAKIIMGDKFIQFVVTNILRVHNRRHPRKRFYIKGEDNPRGIAGKAKGEWWDILEKTSKYNLSIMRNNQQKFVSLREVINKIHNIREDE